MYVNSSRIVLPNKSIRSVLSLLHSSHAGINKTHDITHQLYFWPSMWNNWLKSVSHVEYISPPCRRISDLLLLHQVIWGPPWLDQWSGHPLFHKLGSTTTSSVFKVLSEWFKLQGLPRSIKSDGGPQFSGEFADFCAKYQIKHEVSFPYNPWANGLADSAVKTVKNMLKKRLVWHGRNRQSSLWVEKSAARAWIFSLLTAFWTKTKNATAPAWLSLQAGGFRESC